MGRFKKSGQQDDYYLSRNPECTDEIVVAKQKTVKLSVKKKQQRVQMILDSKQINYEAIDITEPGKEKDKEFMQQNGKVRESLGKYPLPPQIFNDDDFCGDYEDFDLANEVDELEKFLHIETSLKENETDSKQGRELQSKSWSEGQSIGLKYNPYEYHTFKVKYDPVNGLSKQIINSTDSTGESNETEVVTKSEVNGECESVPGLEPSSGKTTDVVETSPEEIFALEKEESSTQESKTNEDSGEKEVEENVSDKEENEVLEEAVEKEEEKEDVEVQEEENVENPKEEKSPPPEEKETEKEQKEEVESEKEEKEEFEGEKEEKGEFESEKEEKESDNESPQSEKSQEE